jgi:hypothetical protein
VHPGNYDAIINALVRRMATKRPTGRERPFAVYGMDRGEAETDRRIEVTPDAQIPDGLLEEIAELDRRYRLVEHARRPRPQHSVASKTHGYREFIYAATSAGKRPPRSTAPNLPSPEPKRSLTSGPAQDGNGRGSAKLAASLADHRSAAQVIVSRLQ